MSNRKISVGTMVTLYPSIEMYPRKERTKKSF